MSGRYLTALTAGVVGILLGLVAPALAQSAHRGIVSLLSAKQTYPPARLIVGTAQRVAWEPYHVRETQSEYYAEHKALYTAQTEGYVAPLLHAEQVTALSGEPGARAVVWRKKTWINASVTNNAWKRVIPKDIGCIWQFVDPLDDTPSAELQLQPYATLGADDYQGIPVWRLRSKTTSQGYTTITDILVGQRDSHIYRSSVREMDPQGDVLITQRTDRTHFGQAMYIQAPPSGAGGQTPQEPCTFLPDP